MDQGKPLSELADDSTHPRASVRDAIAAIKAEHHVSETSAYAMLIRAAVAA